MDGFCADASSVFPTWQVRRLKKQWLENTKLLRGVTNEGEIVLTPVVIGTDHERTNYLMDAVTGTLYKNNKCKSSDHLVLLDIKDEPYLDVALMAIKMKALGG